MSANRLPCPRCHGYIPNSAHPGAHPGAASRAVPERDIEICSACGTDEGFEDEAGRVTPVAEWPVPGHHELTKAITRKRRHLDD